MNLNHLIKEYFIFHYKIKILITDEEKNNSTEKFLKDLDFIGIDLTFNENLKNKLFESQRLENYEKWLKYLVGVIFLLI